MSHVAIARLAAAALMVPCVSAFAAPLDIDLPTALTRARRAAPAAVAARGQVAVAQAQVVGAALPFLENPELEVGVGPRLTSARPLDAELRIAQSLEPWRRTARRRLARAEVASAAAAAAAEDRELAAAVTSAFDEALFAQRSVELAQHGEELASRAADAATRRRRAGEITDLEANLARSALGRARAATLAARATLASTLGQLGALIGAAPDDQLAPRGELRRTLPEALRVDPTPPAARTPEGPDPRAAGPTDRADLRALEVGLSGRADLRALDAERLAADAARGQAVANGRPELTLWASYQREDRDAIVLGGLRVTLPLWNRGQGEQAAADARSARAVALHDATRRAAATELAGAVTAYQHARAAVEGFERDVVPVLDDSEQLLDKAIAAGQLAIGDYLIARQELLDGRREHLERLRALAQAVATVELVAGGAP